MTFPKMNLIEKILLFAPCFYLQNAYFEKVQTQLDHKIENNFHRKSSPTSPIKSRALISH